MVLMKGKASKEDGKDFEKENVTTKVLMKGKANTPFIYGILGREWQLLKWTCGGCRMNHLNVRP